VQRRASAEGVVMVAWQKIFCCRVHAGKTRYGTACDTIGK
jgi:hypothetical protein